MLLIYTEQISHRFTYITQHIFSRMLRIDFEVVSDLERFIMATDPKISYAKSRIADEFFIKNFGLLFEQGINTIDIYVNYKDNIPYFFSSKKGDLHFDIFSASFYLISRYEEYLPFIKSDEDTFPATESIAYKHHFLHLPIVDIWIKQFQEELLKRYPTINFPEKKFNSLSVIEVEQAYAYRHKGLIRNIGQGLKNILQLQLSQIAEQFLVLIKWKNDPLDIFDELLSFQKENQIQSIFFFLLADYNYHDRNISYYKQPFKDLIKMVADFKIVSIMTSYNSSKKQQLQQKERQRMIDIIKRPVKRSRIHKNHIFLPHTYQTLIKSGFSHDFSMGYNSHVGFRAGTCTPFYFYDLTAEAPLPIQIYPFCFHSNVFEDHTPKREIARKIFSLRNQVQNVNGTFIAIFTNKKLRKSPVTEHWRSLYQRIFKK